MNQKDYYKILGVSENAEPMDVFRFHIMAKPGIAISSLGLILFVVGWEIISLSLKENPFAHPSWGLKNVYFTGSINP